MESPQTSPDIAVMPKPAGKKWGRLAAAILLILSGVCLLGCALVLWILRSNDGEMVSSGRPRVGEVMADFSLNDLQGIEVRLSDYQGRPVVLNFWATWCPPCVGEMPLLSEYYLEYQDSGLVVLAVDVGEPWELVEDVSFDLDLPFPVLLDPDQALADSLRINAFPTSILIGRDGVIQKVHVGSYTERELARDLNLILETK